MKRMTIPMLAPALAPALALSLGACAATAQQPVEPVMGGGTCKVDRAQALVGQKATQELGSRALQLTGARSLRWGPPGMMFTRDYRPGRLNITYDATMSVTRIYCG